MTPTDPNALPDAMTAVQECIRMVERRPGNPRGIGLAIVDMLDYLAKLKADAIGRAAGIAQHAGAEAQKPASHPMGASFKPKDGDTFLDAAGEHWTARQGVWYPTAQTKPIGQIVKSNRSHNHLCIEFFSDDPEALFGAEVYAAAPSMAAPSEPQKCPPEGWRLIPIDPTDTMLEAAWAEEITMSEAHSTHGITLHVWHAMIDAAPSPTAACPVCGADTMTGIADARHCDNCNDPAEW